MNRHRTRQKEASPHVVAGNAQHALSGGSPKASAPQGSARVGGPELRPISPLKEVAQGLTLAEERAVHDEIAGNMAMSPALTAAMVVDKFHALKGPAIDANGGVSVVALTDRIERAAAAIRGGDLAEIEELLLAQAHALNSVFVQYALRSAGATTQDRASELLLLAMKAQAGSRATLSALVDLKLPRTTLIAKQANLAQGHQQVNNAAPSAGPGVPAEDFPALPVTAGPVMVPALRARARKVAERTIRGRK